MPEHQGLLQALELSLAIASSSLQVLEAGSSCRQALLAQSPHAFSDTGKVPPLGLKETSEKAQKSLSQPRQASRRAKHQEEVIVDKGGDAHHVSLAEATKTEEGRPRDQAICSPLEIEIDLGDTLDEAAGQGADHSVSSVKGRAASGTLVANQSRPVLQEVRQQSSSRCRHDTQLPQSALAPTLDQSPVKISGGWEIQGLDSDLYETGLWSP